MKPIEEIISDNTAWSVNRLTAFAKENEVTLRQNGDLAVLNYDENIPAARWNDFNRQCRGIILDLASRSIVAHPYDKFFNLDSHPETTYDALPLASGYEIAVKYDGAMVTAFHHNNQIGFATRSSFDNAQTRLARELFQERYPGIAEAQRQQYTLVFELVAPINRSIVPCAENDLVLIGVRDLAANRMMTYSEVAEFARNYDLRAASLVTESVESLFAMARDGDGASIEEGWVVGFRTGLFVKMKTWQYLTHLQIQRLGLTKLQLTRSFCECDARKWAEFLDRLPDSVRTAVDLFGREVQGAIDAVSAELTKAYTPFSGIDSQKEFAFTIQKQVPAAHVPLMFCLRSGKLIEVAIRRRYEEFVEISRDGEVVQPSMLKEWAFREND